MWIVEIRQRGQWEPLCRPMRGVRYTYDTRFDAEAAARGAAAAVGKGRGLELPGSRVRVREID